MPDIDQIFVNKSVGIANDRQVIEGILAKANGYFWVRVDNQSPLWGPVIGGDDSFVGQRVAAVISQKNAPFIVYPVAAGDGGGGALVSGEWVWTTSTTD